MIKEINSDKLNYFITFICTLVYLFIPNTLFTLLILGILKIIFTLKINIVIFGMLFLMSNIMHEIGHYILIKICKVRLLGIGVSIGFGSIKLIFRKCSTKSDIAILLAGPLCNLLIALSGLFFTMINESNVNIELLILINIFLFILNISPVMFGDTQSDGKQLLHMLRRKNGKINIK